jgi:hypothetical protein
LENRTLILLVLVGLFGGSLTSIAQSFKPMSVGIELQGYPAGFITGIRGDFIFSSHWSGNIRAGYNFARRGDLGEHDDENGGGPGISLGTRYYFREKYQGLFLGARLDLWLMEIDWQDEIPNAEPEQGTSNITVVQPMVEGGYTFLLGAGGWSLTAKVSLGFEINVQTSGEEVGEGSISLLGVTLNKRF